MEKIANKIKSTAEYILKRPLLFAGVLGAVLLLSSFFAVYCIRVIFSPPWLGQVPGSLALFALLYTLFLLFYGLYRLLFKRNEPLFCARILFILGVVFTFATPPNQVPDEQSHYLRGVEMAMGQWGFDEHFVFPDDVNLFIESFPTMYNNGYPAKPGNTVYNRFADYYKGLENGKEAPNTGIIIFQFLPYIPLCAGIWLARLLGFTALGAFWAGRLANVLFFSVCAYFALKFSGRFGRIVFALMALPLSCFMYASCNSDSVLFAIMYLMFSCRLCDEKRDMHRLLFSVCFAFLCVCKASFAVFFPLAFLFRPKMEKLRIKRDGAKRFIYLAFTLVLFLLLYQGMGLYVSRFSNYGEIPRTMADTAPAEQLMFIIKNPFRYLAVFLDTLINNAFFLFSGGTFGWLDVQVPLVSYLTPIFLIFARMDNSYSVKKGDRGLVRLFFLCSVLTYGVVMTGLYLSWTPVTLPQIIGLQMRYMLPAFAGFCLLLAYLIRKKFSSSPGSGLPLEATGYVFSIIAAFMMAMVYYLPRKAVVFVA